MNTKILSFLCLSFVFLSLPIAAKNNQQALFLNQIYGVEIPRPQRFKLNSKTQKEIKKILGHAYYLKRIKYWQKGGKRLWILNETGKTKYITAAFVVENNQIIETKVLKFRESRGSEIQFPFFTKQFKNIHIDNNNQLNQQIDGITGATLSVRAMVKMAQLVLYLDQVL